MVWMISANSKMYDHASSFAMNGFIDWRQSAKYEVGDIVYIYCTKPYQKVMFKCEVVKHSLKFSECVDDFQFWADLDEYEKSKNGKYARLRLLEQADSEKLSLQELLKNGLNSHPQGPIKVSRTLCSYIDTYFNDYYTVGLFTDVDDEVFYEGHVKTVTVNAYERSSIARNKCVEYHGSACLICGLNFYEKYGELGKGFIHVHHLKPLHTIRENYAINYKTDLIPVCPNCHAMIHRVDGGETMGIEELVSALNPTKTIQNRNQSNSNSKKFNSAIKDAPNKCFDDMNKGAIPTKLIKHRIFHTSPSFGYGIVISETKNTVKIKFDNGKTATFSKEYFAKNVLRFVD